MKIVSMLMDECKSLTWFPLLQYIDDTLPGESPYLYGLHPNAEIGFLTQTSEKLFHTVLEMQPRDGGVGEGGGTTREEKVKRMTPIFAFSYYTVNLFITHWTSQPEDVDT